MFKSITDVNTNTVNALQSLVTPSVDFDINNCYHEAEGLYIPSGEVLEVKNLQFGDHIAKSVQFWFKGTINSQSSATSSTRFASIEVGGGHRPAHLVRYGNNLIINSAQTNMPYATLSNVFLNDNGDWMLFGLSIGWRGDNAESQTTVCGYFYQAGNTEASDCIYAFDFDNAHFRDNANMRTKITNCQGHVREFYILDYLQFPYLMSEQKSLDKSERFTCRENNTFYQDPGYICDGCGNGVQTSTETTTDCDDLDADDTDGCSST